MSKKASIITALLITTILLKMSFATNSVSKNIPSNENSQTIEETVKDTESISTEDTKTDEAEPLSEEETGTDEEQIPEEEISAVEEQILEEDIKIEEIAEENITQDEQITEDIEEAIDEKNIIMIDTEFQKIISDEKLAEVFERLENNGVVSKIEDLKLENIIKNEEISDELRHKIQKIIDIAQSELDSYRTTIKNNEKITNRRILSLRQELSRVQNFRDQAEQDLQISRWMVLTLSMGVICLTFLIVIIWRNMTNIGKNEIEVLFAYKDLKKDLNKINEQIEVLDKKSKITSEENKNLEGI